MDDDGSTDRMRLGAVVFYGLIACALVALVYYANVLLQME